MTGIACTATWRSRRPTAAFACRQPASSLGKRFGMPTSGSAPLYVRRNERKNTGQSRVGRHSRVPG